MSDWVSVTVSGVKGSAPREVGAWMAVSLDTQVGTIGGGALEWDALRIARDMLAKDTVSLDRTFTLGPDLGQCCGGVVALSFKTGLPEHSLAGEPLWVWGAGHVGRALVDVLAPLQDREITWVDTDKDRFPSEMPRFVSPLAAQDPTRVVIRAPDQANHLVMTYSHDLDLALCDALLRRITRSIGLIGSATKLARFRSRLRQMGHKDDQINRINCPIGDPLLGKAPQAIAIGVAARLLSQSDEHGG